jgi:hypothetical protein
MEHTISLHDSSPEPSPEPFEVSASHGYEDPLPLHAFVAESASDGWVQEEVHDEAPEADVAEFEWHDEPAETAAPEMHEIHAVHEVPYAEAHVGVAEETWQRRVVLQMTDGATVELRRMVDEAEAVAFARDAVRRIAAAEASGEWPELDGRFLRPESIFSVDIQVAG